MNSAMALRYLETLGRLSAEAGLIVLLVLLTQWAFRRWLTPRWRCALWLLVVGRLLLPVSLPTSVSLFNLIPRLAKQDALPVARSVPLGTEQGSRVALADAETPPAPTASPVREAQQRIAPGDDDAAARRESSVVPAPTTLRRSPPLSWPWLLLFVWLAGAVTLTTHLITISVRVARRFHGLPEVSDPEVRAVLEECRKQMSGRTRLRLVEGADVPSPALHGVFRPRLLLPAGFTKAFSAAELQFVFLHELAHVKRQDMLMNWIVALLQIVHWFNPLLWFGFTRWRADRELACDALVLEVAGAGCNREYGRTILRLLQGFTGRIAAPGLVGILEDKRQLQRRIAMIAAFAPMRRSSLIAAMLLLALALIGLTDAQTPKPKEKQAAIAPVPATPPTADTAGAKQAAVPAPKTNRALTRFTVVEKETGAPLGGARLAVTYFYSGSRTDRREVVTDEAGMALIPDYEQQTSSGVNVFVTPEDHVPKVISWNVRDDIPPAYTMRMARATRVAGVVQDKAGQPVAGVKVNLERPGIRDATERENIDFHPRLTAVITDRNGRWSFSYVPKEFESVGVFMDHPDFAVTQRSVPVLKPESTNAILIIERGVTIQGRVIGPEKQPVANATVKELHNYGYDARSTQTANDGSYALKGIRPGEIQLVVQADGLAPQIRTLQESGPAAQANFSLTQGKTFRGRVVDKEGKPIAGAFVSTDWDNQGLRKIAWETNTDTNGRFEWKAAPDESLLFWFAAEGYTAKRDLLLRPGDADHEIVLDPREAQAPPIRVSGRAIDAATQQPIPSFKVSLGQIRHPDFPPDYESGTRGRDGEFRLTINAPCPFPSYVLRVEADGYLPAKSPPQAIKDGNTVLDFALKKGSGPSGVIRLSDGRPGAHAMVYYCTLRDGVYIDKPGEVRQNVTHAVQARADEQGHFTLPALPDAHSLIVLHDEGFAEVKAETLAQSTNVVLSQWGRVEGQLFTGTKPAADETISVQTMTYRYGDGGRSFAPLSLWLLAQTDNAGKFVIEKVPPGERKITHRLAFRQGKPGAIPETHAFPFNVKPGETTRVVLGGTGQPVIGRVVVQGYDEPIDWLRDVHRMTLKLSDPSERPRPGRDEYADEAAFVAALNQYSAQHKAFWLSEEGRALERAQRGYIPIFKADGSFRVDDVPPGVYELVLKPTRSGDADLGPSRFLGEGKPIGVLTNVFTIPDLPKGRSDEPLDLGTLTLKAAKTLKVGQAAPPFEIKTVDGKVLKLQDYRGKFVLMDFWATWCGPCVAELPHLKAAWQIIEKDERGAMLGLSLDAKAGAPRQFAKTNGMDWTQGFLGEWSKTSVPNDYAVEGIPAIFLISPEGKILAKDLRGPAIQAEVVKALRQR